jgi:hypothetical protein
VTDADLSAIETLARGNGFVQPRDVLLLVTEVRRLRDLFGDHGLDPDRCGKYPGGEQCALRHGHAGRCEWANGD